MDEHLKRPVEEVAQLLYCSKWLEEAAAKLYRMLAERLDDELVASFMKVISAQSAAHAEVMEAIVRSLNLDEVAERLEPDCVELTKPVGQQTLSLIEELSRMDRVDEKEFLRLRDKMIFLEDGVGEETYHRVLLPILNGLIETLAAKGLEKDKGLAELARDLLLDVIREEKLHELLVRRSSEFIGKGRPPLKASV
jgi:rubrerythrin